MSEPKIKFLTEEQISNICLDYSNHISPIKIGVKYELSRQSIERILCSRNIRLRGNGKFENLTSQIMESMRFDYLSGMSIEDVSKKYGFMRKSIRRIFSKLGVKIRPGGRRFLLNDDVFNVVTPDSAYWIGFLMADGNVLERRINVKLSMKDEAHLYKLKEFLGFSGNINKWKSEYPSLSVYSSNLVEKLISYGVTPRKSLTCKVIGLESNRDFWRGVVDGDGSLGIYSNCSTLQFCSGSKFFMEQFYSYVKTVVPSWIGNIKKIQNKNLYHLQIRGKNALIIIDNLYKNASIYLERKMILAQKIISRALEEKFVTETR